MPPARRSSRSTRTVARWPALGLPRGYRLNKQEQKELMSIIDHSVTPNDGDVLTWDEATGKYVPQAPSGGGSNSGIQYVDVQLTDAQIKALPTTPVTVVTAPAAGSALLPLAAYLLARIPVTPYGTIDATASLTVTHANANGPFNVTWDEQEGQVSQLLGAAGSNSLAFGTADKVLGSTLSNYADGADQSYYDGTALVLAAFNGAGGDFTGGASGNTLSVRVWFSTVPTVPFGA